MFAPKNARVAAIGAQFPGRIRELDEVFFAKPTVVYIDWANVIHWQDKIDWHIDLKRIKLFLDSFDQVKKVRLYCGTLVGNLPSEQQIVEAKSYGYEVCTKPVKLMKMSMDVSSIPKDSPTIVKKFMKKAFLKKLDLETISFLNAKLRKLNQQGALSIEEQKCNFDVEMGRDMLADFNEGVYDNFVLWSGDSDFECPVKQLLGDEKSVLIFSISGRVTSEIDLPGVFIFDVRKIKEFICWPREIPESLKSKIALFISSR